MKLIKAEADRLQEFVAERCNRPDWKTPNPLEEYQADFVYKIVSAMAALWMIVLTVAILYHTLFWGVMLLATLSVFWLSFKEMLQHSSDMIQTLGMALRAFEHPSEANSLHLK